MVQKKWFGAKGPEASRLRRRKYEIIRQYGFPESALPGAMTQTFRRCGKPTCHCAGSEGHPMWVLSFSVDGTKHTETIPESWVAELEPLITEGRECREALAEMLRLNAELLRLWRQEQRERAARTSKGKGQRTPKRPSRRRKASK